METVKQANMDISNLLGEQLFKNGIKYRKFTQTFFLSKNGHFIAYNMLTGELIKLSEKEFLTIETASFQNDKVLQERLVKKWFLVAVDNDDMHLCNQVIDFLKLCRHKKNIKFFSILTTTNCNARCFYCYEYGLKKIDMAPKIAEDVANYLIKKAGGEKITIRWFGGEPLCNTDAIDIITNNLKKNDAEFESTMITNGFLFDQEMIKRAKNVWNLKWVQVTLDGTEEVYNKTKNYIHTGNINPFDLVISNILALIKNDIYVVIRMNFENHNIDELCKLAEFLSEKLPRNGKCSVYPQILYDNSGNVQYHRTEESLERLMLAYESVSDSLLMANLLSIRKLPSMPRLNSCMADDDSAILILPDGRITKCEHTLDRDIIGNIYSDQYDESVISSWKKIKVKDERCKECPVWLNCILLEKCETNKECFKFNRINKCKQYEKMIWHEYEKKTGTAVLR